jgi:hypothetical protein
MRTATTTQTKYLDLTRRLRGAYASRDAYRRGRRGAAAAPSAEEGSRRMRPCDAQNVVPFRPR